MILKAISKKLRNIAYKILLLHRFRSSPRQDIRFKKCDFLLAVITFNNVEILRKQYEYLKKFLNTPHDYLVADNSDNPITSMEIEEFCHDHNISYVKIPNNPLTGVRASGSHGIALNWVYRNIIQKYQPKYFGFLDHDIFPIREAILFDKMALGFYGAIRKRKEPFWYLWPGFCFYEYEKVKRYKCDFSPYHAGADGLTFLDTGGSNYNSIYRNIGRTGVREAKSILINSVTGKEFVKGEDSSRTFEIIEDTWLHLRQIAWRAESSNKMDNLEELIRIADKHIR